MASLHAKHSRSCALGRLWTKLDAADGSCTCEPVFYVVVRQGAKSEKIRAGKNRRQAERALRKFAVEVDEGSYRPQLNVAFDAWADKWLASLERKETTRDSYRSTITYAKEIFGSEVVRRLAPSDVAAFNAFLREQDISPSTRGKHLRVLGACVNSAVRHGYAARNPVRELPSAERPRPAKKESAYFLDEELVRLFAKVDERLFYVLFMTALKTGMRQGELLSLTWGDCNLIDATLRVRRSITDGHVSLPKSDERRDVDLTPDLVDLFCAWWGECGEPADDLLVFSGELPGGHLTPSTILRRELYPDGARRGPA